MHLVWPCYNAKSIDKGLDRLTNPYYAQLKRNTQLCLNFSFFFVSYGEDVKKKLMINLQWYQGHLCSAQQRLVEDEINENGGKGENYN